MSTAAQWQAALAQHKPGRTVRILFGRLGLVAQCRSLTAGEVAECAEMGGEAGARYALYLACDALRQAGDALQKQGEILSPFDITRRIPYADTAAAAALIFSLSGAGEADIRLLEEDEDEGQAIAMAQAMHQSSEGAAPSAALPISDGDDTAAIVPPVPAVPAAASAVIPRAAQLLPDSGRRSAENAAEIPAAEVFSGVQVPAAQILSPQPAPQALTADAVWWEKHETAAGQTRRSAASAPAQTGSDPDPDAFARVLADRLRDAAGNM